MMFGGLNQLLARALQPPVRHHTAAKAADKAARSSPNMGGVEGGRRDMLISCGSRTPAKKYSGQGAQKSLKGGEGGPELATTTPPSPGAR
eukprot:gene8222-biopygen18108